jgi:hypothetical protein
MDSFEALAYLHPPVASTFTVLEHPAGQLGHLGDALGADCAVVDFVGGWVQAYRTDGASNEDWFGWREPLLAPFDGSVVSIRDNPVVNEPGAIGSPPAAAVTFLRADDGLHVVYAHVQDVEVTVGSVVRRGEAVARIGNNGMCRHPHVHVGAWSGDSPLQIRFDLEALGQLHRYRSIE